MSDVLLNIDFTTLNNADRIVIGLSGGADSVALTHILYSKLGSEKLLCAHVNHSIRGKEAESDALFAENFAKSLGIEFKLLIADIPKLSKSEGIGMEECGRRVRYEFFNSLTLSEKSLIATAHNADDNAETLIMNLLRGSGSKGLSGIPYKRGNVIRPILSLTRGEIEAYNAENNLSFVTDSTNSEDIYLRNKVRHTLIKDLKELSGDFIKNTYRATRILGDDINFLQCEAEKLYSKLNKGDYIDVSEFTSYHVSLKRNLVNLILKENGASDLTEKHVNAVIDAIENGKSLSVPKNKFVNVKQNKLTVTSALPVKQEYFTLSLGENRLENGKIIKISEKKIAKNEKIHNLLFNISVDCDKINGDLKAGPRKEGDSFTFTKRNLRKSLKKLFNELKIPASLREKVTVIRDEKGVVFIENVGVSKEYAVSDKTENILTIEIFS